MEAFTKEQLMSAVQYAMEYQQAEDYQRVGALKALWHTNPSSLTAEVLDQLSFVTAPVVPLTYEQILEQIVKP